MTRQRVEVAVVADAAVGEGPTWDQASASLLWVDLYRGVIRRDWSDGRTWSQSIGRHVGFVLPTAAGGLIAGLPEGVVRLTEDDGTELLLPLPPDDNATMINDGKCDAYGRLWFGTARVESKPWTGRLYRTDPKSGLELECVVPDCGLPNGLDWSPQHDRFYHADSVLNLIFEYEYDIEQGRLLGRRALVSLDGDDGIVDGLTVDVEGHIWVALWGSGQVRRYCANGRLDRTISLPVDYPASVCLGGPEMRTLFITTAREPLDEQALSEQPLAGSVLSIDAPAPGHPAHACHAFG